MPPSPQVGRNMVGAKELPFLKSGVLSATAGKVLAVGGQS